MRGAGLILSGFLSVALAAPALAVPALRYSIEVPSGEDGTPPAAAPLTPVEAQMAPPVRTATAEPVAHPPLRYSIEAEDAPPSQPASQSAPQTPRYSAGVPHASAPVQQIAVTQPAERTTVSRRRR